MLLLCISDVHGHLDALQAVLATAERRAFQKLLVAGDLVFPGPEPLETWRRLSAAGAILVQGLTDRAVATLDPGELRATTEHDRALGQAGHQSARRTRASAFEKRLSEYSTTCGRRAFFHRDTAFRDRPVCRSSSCIARDRRRSLCSVPRKDNRRRTLRRT